MRRVACVFAHPDDDTFGVGGSLALHAEDELGLTVILATSGDAGRIADASLATRETLARVREAEDLASWSALGLDPDVRFLRYPDGGLNATPRGELLAEVQGVLEEVAPEVVITFGPDGITGHDDHVAIGAIATEAFGALRTSSGGAAFSRLLHNAIAQSTLDRLNELLRGRGLEPMDPAEPFMPRGVPDAAIGARVDASSVYERKLEAIRCHKTQDELEDVPFDLWPEMLSIESFVVAWPERRPRDPVLGDLFDFILARVEIDFRSELRMGEEVEVRTRCPRIGTKSFDLEHEVATSGGRVVAEAKSVLVSYDYKRGESVVVPQALRERLQP